MIKRLYRDFSGLLIIFALYFAWCCMTVSYNNGLFLVFSIIASMTALGVFLHNADLITDKTPALNPIMAVILVDITKGACKSAFHKTESAKTAFVSIAGRQADRAELTLSFIAFVWLLSVIILIVKKRDKYREHMLSLKERIVNVRWLILLLFLAALLSYDPDWKQYKWDSLLYCQASSILDITLFSEMGVYGHISQGFSAFVKLLEYVFEDIGRALFAGNIILLVLGSAYVYALLKLIFSDKRELFYLAGTAVYAFSPYYLGMVNYYSLDYYLMCTLPVLVYYAYSRKWIQMTITAVFFCFTKETAILIYGLFCVGIVLADSLADLKSEASDKSPGVEVKRLLTRVHYYYMATPGILWLVTYKMLGPWVGGSHSVGISPEYVINKLKVLYILNYNWLFTLLVVTGFIACICKKLLTVKDMSVIIPLFTAQIGFTVFNLVFVTANHPRYTDSTPYTLYILAIFFAGKLTGKKALEYCMSLFAAVMLIQSFITIDPVTLLSFENYNAGNMKLVSSAETLGDSAVYNKQMLWAERPLCEAIADAAKEDTVIAFTAFNGTTNITDGMATVPTVTYTTGKEKQYWRSSDNRRAPFATDETRELEICHITEKGSLTEIAGQGEQISIIYSDIDDEAKIAKLLSEMSIEEEEEYSYRGWIFHRVTGRVK